MTATSNGYRRKMLHRMIQEASIDEKREEVNPVLIQLFRALRDQI